MMTIIRRIAVCFGLSVLSLTGCQSVSAGGAEELAVYRLKTQGGMATLVGKDSMLLNRVSGSEFPCGFVLPDEYCDRDDLSYTLDFKYQTDRPLDGKGRSALFAVGLNISGSMPDSVSMVFLGSNTLFSRFTGSDSHERGQLVSRQNIQVGQSHRVRVTFGSHRMQVALDGQKLGVTSTSNVFKWVKGRPLYLSCEEPRKSVLPGRITELTLTINRNPKEEARTKVSANPYQAKIVGAADGVLASGSQYFEKRIATEKNDWLYRDMANNTALLAYCYTLPGTKFYRSPAVLAWLDRAINYLCSVNNVKDWVSKKHGDPNINRFTLVPLLEAISFVGEDLPKETRERISKQLRQKLMNQYETHGKLLTGVEKVYPNMDAYYLISMLHGSRLLKDELFTREYERVLQLLADAQYPDGAWPYIMTTNENIGYHDIVTASVARAYSVTKSPVALAMIKKSIPFYPLSVGPNLIPEYATDPHWKHNWSNPSSIGPDIVAGLTDDPQNRWLARKSPLHGTGILGIYAAMFWKPGPVNAVPNNRVVFDRNIYGPRGHFKKWDWVCSGNYGTDTVVGCYSLKPGESTRYIKGLLSVRAEIGRLPNGKPTKSRSQHSLAMPPPENKGTTQINGRTATFTTDYKMVCLRNIWGVEAFPKDWSCKEKWELGPAVVKGEIQITSNADQNSPAPQVRFLFGRYGKLVKVAANEYTYGAYRLKILQSDFPVASTAPAPSSSFGPGNLDGMDLLLSTKREQGNYTKGQTFKLKVQLTKD